MDKTIKWSYARAKNIPNCEELKSYIYLHARACLEHPARMLKRIYRELGQKIDLGIETYALKHEPNSYSLTKDASSYRFHYRRNAKQHYCHSVGFESATIS